MDAGDHQIETREHILGIIEGAVREDVALDSLQDPETLAEALVEPVGLAVLPRIWSTERPPA